MAGPQEEVARQTNIGKDARLATAYRRVVSPYFEKFFCFFFGSDPGARFWSRAATIHLSQFRAPWHWPLKFVEQTPSTTWKLCFILALQRYVGCNGRPRTALIAGLGWGPGEGIGESCAPGREKKKPWFPALEP